MGKSKSFTPEKYVKKQESSRKKGYDHHWDKYRFRFLHYNPKCYTCGVKATVVDHIKAHKGDSKLFEATNNHLPLCSKCHNTITGKFDRQSQQDLEGKMKYIREMRISNNITSTVKVLPLYRK